MSHNKSSLAPAAVENLRRRSAADSDSSWQSGGRGGTQLPQVTFGCETRVLLCCYHAFNAYYYKYTVHGINIFALNLLPLVFITLIIGYTDREHHLCSAETKFATAITSIIPLSYYIGMGIASISALLLCSSSALLLTCLPRTILRLRTC